MDNKRGQEEMIGFVVIVVIVAVIFLVFLGISVRSDSVDVIGSVEAYHFLESAMEYTTDCSKRFENDLMRLGEVLRACDDGTQCLDGRDSCDVLDEKLDVILRSSFNVAENGRLKGFEFSASRVSGEVREEVIRKNAGECLGNVRGASYVSFATSGKMESVLKLCL